MGKIIQFPNQQVDIEALRKDALAAFRQKDYARAAELLNRNLEVAANRGERPNREVIIKLTRTYLATNNVAEAADIVEDHLTELLPVQIGRQLVMDVAIRVPNFTMIEQVIVNAYGDEEAELFGITRKNLEQTFNATNGSQIEATVRRVRHIGGFGILDQETICSQELPRVPVQTVLPAVLAALVDVDAHPLTRTTLATWLKLVGVDEDVTILVRGERRTFNPFLVQAAADVEVAREIQTVLLQNLDPGSPLPEVANVMVGMLYPFAADYILDPVAFVRSMLAPQQGGRYAGLIEWLNAQLLLLSNG